MDIIIDGCQSYPTTEIAERSLIFRTLGLGYANLGALLMSLGLPMTLTRGEQLRQQSLQSCVVKHAKLLQK